MLQATGRRSREGAAKLQKAGDGRPLALTVGGPAGGARNVNRGADALMETPSANRGRMVNPRFAEGVE